MTRKATVLTVLAVVGVVGLVGGLGWDERRRGEGELGWLADKLVNGWGREAEAGIAFSDSVYVEGPAMSDWCKTAMTTTWTVSFDISFMSPEPGKFTERLESVMCICFLPGVEVRLANYGEVVEDEAGNKYNRFGYGAIVNSYGLEPAYDGGYTDYPADGGTYSLSGSVGIGTVLNKRTGDTPIGTKTNATHAKERWAEEGWGIPTGQMGYATIGDASKCRRSWRLHRPCGVGCRILYRVA